MKLRTPILILLLATLLLPSTHALSTQTGKCVNNLKNIDLSKRILAHDRNLKTNDIVTLEDLREILSSPKTCPAGGTYTIGPIGTPAKCSIPTHSPEEFSKIIKRHKMRQRLETALWTLPFALALIALPTIALFLCRRRQIPKPPEHHDAR